MNRAPEAIALLVLVAVLATTALPYAEGSGQSEPYPDADVLIYSDGDGVVVEYVAESVTETYEEGSDVTVASNSEVSSPLSVVMMSGTLGTLTLLTVDGVSQSIDLDFTMVSGTLGSLVAVAAEDGAALPASYYSAYRAVDSLTITIGGSVTEVITTSDRVEVGSLELVIASSAEVDRLYPTGDDGVYGDVTVSLEGGAVGYMSNRAAVVESLTYELKAGSVDYLCIGADTEGGSTDLWTFHVRGDVGVTIGSSCSVGTAVVGGGILSAPSTLRSGEAPDTLFSRTVVIDAPDEGITVTTCFLTSSGPAYRLTTYTLGGSAPSARDLSGNYGDGGVWESADHLAVEGGTVLYLNTTFDVVSGSVFTVEAGGRVVNAGYIVLTGSMASSGTVVNNGIIEVLATGSFEGETNGTGFVASGLTGRTVDSKLDVLVSDRNAVVVRSSSGELLFEEFSVNFEGIFATVVITAPDSMYIGGETFVVGLSLTEGDGYDLECGIHLAGFDAVYTGALTVRVTIPVTVPSGFLVSITDSTGEEMEAVSCTSTQLVFDVPGSGTYSISVYREAVEEEETDWTLLINSVIAVAIVVVAVTVVRLLLRRD